MNSLVLPCYHIFGLYITMYSLLAGSTIVSLNKFRPEIFLKSIESYKVTKLFIVPPIAIYLVKSPSVLNYDLSSVKFILSGAAPLRQEIYNQLRKRLVQTLKSYITHHVFFVICIMFFLKQFC